MLLLCQCFERISFNSTKAGWQRLENSYKHGLQTADLKAGDIDFINAHGTATQNNDLVEGRVFKNMFAPGIKVFSIKGYTGHTLGAAGAIDAVLTVLSLMKQWIPRNAGFSIEDHAIGLSPVSSPMDVKAKYALSTSLAFGGNNSALIFKRL